MFPTGSRTVTATTDGEPLSALFAHATAGMYAAAPHTQPLGRLCVGPARHLGDRRDGITLIGARIPPRR
ncbi:hypothetical protein [Streptomyces liangshanensis]|uniref:hypothetical protein n=1 Tax=Streptomyces liangshanensis TaxID=2717324 RepID=UPI0036DA40E8